MTSSHYQDTSKAEIPGYYDIYSIAEGERINKHTLTFVI